MRYLHAEELQIASQFLFLSMAITVMEQDVHHIKMGSFKIKEPYFGLLQVMISEAMKERRQLRKKMYDQNLKVFHLRKSDLFSTFLFVCQGREEERSYFNPAIRKKVKKIIIDRMEMALLHGLPDMSANT